MIEKRINPVAAAYKAQYSVLPDATKKQIDKLEQTDPKEYQLKVIKRKRIEPTSGDIFLLSPREGIYFYGLVYSAPIDTIDNNSFTHGRAMIFIYNEKTRGLTDSNFKGDYNNLLVDPTIVDKSYWSRGFFYNVGKKTLNDVHDLIDYGFVKIGIKKDTIVDERGIELNRQPSILGIHGISTITGVARRVEKELIINPSLLEFE